MKKLENLKLLDNRILVQLEEVKSEVDGILVVTSEDVEQTIGVVVLTGNGLPDKEMEVQVGDKVMFNRYSGTSITISGTQYKIILDIDVLIIIK